MKFAEFYAGQIIEAGPRIVSEAEILEFAQRYDPQPFHMDPKLAAQGLWGGLIASGWMTCGIAMELLARTVLTGSESIGGPGVDKLRWEHPVRPGDTLRLQVTIEETRKSSSGRYGVVRWQWVLHNQRNQRVLDLVCTSLFAAAAPAADTANKV